MNATQIRERLGEIAARSKVLSAKTESLTADERSEITALSNEADTLRADLTLVESLERNQVLPPAVVSPATRMSVPPSDDPQPRVVTRTRDPRPVRGRHGGIAFTSRDDAYDAGCWFSAQFFGNARAAEHCRTHGLEVRALTGASNPLGGFLVPNVLEQSIIDLREEYGVFRREAQVVNMPSDTYTQPRRTGGVTAYWVGDNDEITASDKGWDAVTLTARKLGALCKYSSEIADDAFIDIAADLASEIAYAFAVKEDACGFLGDGTQATYGSIVGVKNALAAGSVYTAITGNTAFSTLDLADFEAMVGKLPAYPGISPKWFISKAGWAASMMRLADAAGGNTKGDLASGGGMEFLGYPVVFCQNMNSTLTAQTSTAGLLHFGDLRMAAMLGSRRDVRIKVSDQRYFELDQWGIQGTERFDINVHDVGTASLPGSMLSLTTYSS